MFDYIFLTWGVVFDYVFLARFVVFDYVFLAWGVVFGYVFPQVVIFINVCVVCVFDGE